MLISGNSTIRKRRRNMKKLDPPLCCIWSWFFAKWKFKICPSLFQWRLPISTRVAARSFSNVHAFSRIFSPSLNPRCPKCPCPSLPPCPITFAYLISSCKRHLPFFFASIQNQMIFYKSTLQNSIRHVFFDSVILKSSSRFEIRAPRGMHRSPSWTFDEEWQMHTRGLA